MRPTLIFSGMRRGAFPDNTQILFIIAFVKYVSQSCLELQTFQMLKIGLYMYVISQSTHVQMCFPMPDVMQFHGLPITDARQNMLVLIVRVWASISGSEKKVKLSSAC